MYAPIKSEENTTNVLCERSLVNDEKIFITYFLLDCVFQPMAEEDILQKEQQHSIFT